MGNKMLREVTEDDTVIKLADDNPWHLVMQEESPGPGQDKEPVEAKIGKFIPVTKGGQVVDFIALPVYRWSINVWLVWRSEQTGYTGPVNRVCYHPQSGNWKWANPPKMQEVRDKRTGKVDNPLKGQATKVLKDGTEDSHASEANMRTYLVNRVKSEQIADHVMGLIKDRLDDLEAEIAEREAKAA